MASDKTLKQKKKVAIKSILISQPPPTSDKSPYFAMEEKYGVKIDFRPFIQVKGVVAKEFRKNKILLTNYSAIIFTSRNAVDHFFRLAEEIGVKMPETTKYFCVTEAIALYLQKYILYRKRKVFYGNGSIQNITALFMKHKEKERFLFPCSDIHKDDIPNFLEKNDFNYTKAVFYKTIDSDLSDLKNLSYDMIVFFSPTGVRSLFSNFPKFKQNNTKIATFGAVTAKAVKDANLKLELQVPMPEMPSMTMAIEHYLKQNI